MSDTLSIRIHEGGHLAEREIIVLPKGTTVYAPGGVTVRTTGPVCEVNVLIGGSSDEIARRVAELIRKGTPPAPGSEEICLG